MHVSITLQFLKENKNYLATGLESVSQQITHTEQPLKIGLVRNIYS